MWMHDAAQLCGQKRVTRSIPWRPEWVRRQDAQKSGPAGEGIDVSPTPATVPTAMEVVRRRDAGHRLGHSFRARLRVARPCRHG